jgi:hypothetical protein
MLFLLKLYIKMDTYEFFNPLLKPIALMVRHSSLYSSRSRGVIK